VHSSTLLRFIWGGGKQAKELWAEAAKDGLIRTPDGAQRFRGIPFILGAGGEPARKSWIALARSARPWTSAHVQIPVGRTARFLCLAQFCD
jgi:hypothetical protein